MFLHSMHRFAGVFYLISGDGKSDFFCRSQAGRPNGTEEKQPEQGDACGDGGGRGRARSAAHRPGDQRRVGELQSQPVADRQQVPGRGV